MTTKFEARCNGDSYFTIDDLINLKGMVDYCERKSNGKLMGFDAVDLLVKLDMELVYIELSEGVDYASKS